MHVPAGRRAVQSECEAIDYKVLFLSRNSDIDGREPDLIAGAILMVVDGAGHGWDRIAAVMTVESLLKPVRQSIMTSAGSS